MPIPVINPEENKDKDEESADWFKDAGVDLDKFLDPRENTYGLEDITRKFPKDVAPTRKEAYLTNDVFMKTFDMTKKDFYALKTWRQDRLKKSKGIFWIFIVFSRNLCILIILIYGKFKFYH